MESILKKNKKKAAIIEAKMTGSTLKFIAKRQEHQFYTSYRCYT
jgi:hypothetical protein